MKLLAAAFWLLVAACPALAAQQPSQFPKLMVGNDAPSIKVERWLKGEPVAALEKGRVYIVEFWATWCGPCLESMPHLTELQKKHTDRVTVVGVSIREGGPKDEVYDEAVRNRVAEFVKRHDDEMGYTVAFDGPSKHMRTAWADAAGESGVPTAMVVSGGGKVAYIGHPMSPAMEQAVEQLLDGTFDLPAAAAAYRERMAEKLEFGRALKLFEEGKPDEAVAAIDSLVAKSQRWARPGAVEKFRNLIDAKRYSQAIAIVPSLIDEHLKDDGQLLCAVADSIVELPEAERNPALPLALRAAQRAVELNSRKYPVPPATLAAVYWAMGERAEAVRWQRQAVEFASAEGKHNFEPKLAEYESAK
jgi:thiol-disulfide isomerase/thioredoxin